MSDLSARQLMWDMPEKGEDRAFVDQHWHHAVEPGEPGKRATFVVINHGGEVLGQCPGRATFTECLRERGHGGICSLAPETAMHGARRRGGW